MFKLLFWIFFFFAIYSYFVYPILLKLIALVREDDLPEVFGTNASSSKPMTMTLIVTAYNEEKRIRDKIENTLSIAFDLSRLELIVASDCSDDSTDSIVTEYSGRSVRLVRAEERLGKENAQLAAIRQAKGDIIVFSDVATHIPPDALQLLEKYFTDAKVGAVSSEDRFVSQDGTVAGEGAYVKYEMWLRRLESRMSGLVGLSGSFFAARKEVCQEWDIHCPSDFNTALNTAKQGLKAITAPDVLGFYQDLKDPSKEYQRKVRTVIRGMTGLARHKEILDFKTYGLFAFQVISHKLMRWLAPWFFIGLFVISTFVAHYGGIYLLALLGQIVFYGAAAAAQFLPNLRDNTLIKIVYFFVQVNIALLDASMKFLSGQRMTTWKPSAR